MLHGEIRVADTDKQIRPELLLESFDHRAVPVMGVSLIPLDIGEFKSRKLKGTDLNQIFCIEAERVVNKDNTISYETKTF